MDFILDEEIRGSRPRPPGRTVFFATPMAVDLRTRRNESLLFVRSLDPNFYGFPLHLDCSTYGRLVFASSYEERVPLYLRQQTASLSSDKDPNPKLLQRKLLSKWNQGADAPLLEKRGGGGDGW